MHGDSAIDAASTSVSACVAHSQQVSGEEIYVVVNAGCRDKDLAHIGKHLDEWKVRLVLDLYP